MSWCVWYARKGHEMEAQAEIEKLGIRAVVPLSVEAVRRGYRRRAEPVVSPVLPNYVFTDGDATDWHAVASVAKLAPTMIFLADSVARRYLLPFIAKTEADFTERMAAIEAGRRLEEYRPGDALAILSGPFEGQLARFRRIVETSFDYFPMIEADMEMFGRITTVKVDPIKARKAC
jgi:transcription antitermination factor NusG